MCIKDKDYSWSINADGEVVIYFSKQSDTVLELASMMKGSCCKFLIKSAENLTIRKPLESHSASVL